MADLPLGAEFPPPSHDQWMHLVAATLKGAPFDKLVATTYDGLRVAPLYPRRADVTPMPGRALGQPWEILQRVDHPDPAAANAQALQDLMNGATGLSLVLAGASSAHRFGIAADAVALERTLDGVLLEAIALECDLGPNAQAVTALASLIRTRRLDPAALQIRFGLDPIGARATLGTPGRAGNVVGPIGDLVRQGFRGPFVVADGRAVHAAGGSEAQELAFVLSVGVAYLRALEAGGLALDEARRAIFFRLTADADQFLTIAKFRALRTAWAQIETACGLAPAPIFVSAQTAWRMMTRRDPWVNMLRTTVATFAAGLGGANAITVLPFTAALGLPDGAARRIARNTQLILLEESNLARVTDPGLGSGAIETLTEELARTAYGAFQDIEAAGGAEAALEQGLIQGRVAATRAERDKAIARRKEPLTGTSEFPNILEAPVKVLDVAPHAVPPVATPGFVPLAAHRLAEPFEALREASDRHLAAHGVRPKVFLANLGALAAFSARAMFAKNFFEAGGIEAVGNDGFDSHDAMVAAFKASGAALACLCSSDAVYAGEAVAAATALTAAQPRQLYLAGRPGELEAALKAAGVQSFIFAGCDVLTALQAAHDLLAGASRGASIARSGA